MNQASDFRSPTTGALDSDEVNKDAFSEPAPAVVAVADEVLRVKPDINGWREVSDGDLQMLTGYKSRRTIEDALDDLRDHGMIEKTESVRCYRKVRIIPGEKWAAMLARIELVGVWS